MTQTYRQLAPRLIAAFAALPLLLSPALAQTPAGADTPPAEASTSKHNGHHRHHRHATKMETVEDRIARLHTALKITPEQDAAWAPVAQAMRDNAGAMDRLVADATATPPKDMTAVDDLKAYRKFAQAHADGLTTLIKAFETFYATLPADQQKLADDVFEKFGRNGREHRA